MLNRSPGDVISRLRRERSLSDTELAKQADLRVGTLRDIESGVPPTEIQIQQIASALEVEPDSLRLLSGEFPDGVDDAVFENPDQLLNCLRETFEFGQNAEARDDDAQPELNVAHETQLGTLYENDCRDVLPQLEAESFDLVFADPPFNLDKDYGENNDDDLAEDEYLRWCTEWIDECTRILKPGGSFFLYNLPEWNIHLAHHLNRRLTFRHWISIDIKYSLPIKGRLYPSNYSLLYFVKGDRPRTFDPHRLPVDTCRHCGGEQPDYGGYKSKMNPQGVNLTDVWDDIPPVRHKKYLNRDANQLSLKLLHRVIGLATENGDRVFDPFGGAGTTYAAAELMDREWVGSELHDCTPIVERFANLEEDREYLDELEEEYNILFTEEALEKRMKYKDEFNFNFESYDLSESPIDSIQKNLDSW